MNLDYVCITPAELDVERTQATQEGRDIADLLPAFEELIAEGLTTAATRERAGRIVDEVQTRPLVAGFPYDEPSDLGGIVERRRGGPDLQPAPAPEALLDRIHGAWVGRCCGCLLGKPVEGWRRERLFGYLRDLDRYPLDRYLTARVDDAIRDKYQLDPGNPGFIENVSAMPEDDDTNYTVVGFAVVKLHGKSFTPEHVAEFWLGNIPAYHTFTAERVAYRNLLNQVPPPHSASWRNPYREWIGAQIRADGFGYVAAGDPELAAELAWRDASISHVKNGIYGEMWAAAMVAAAFRTDDPAVAIRAGLAQVPARSRLVEAIDRVFSWRDEGLDYEAALARLHAEWDETKGHDWCHTISNAMIVAMGLLWGEGDYALSICRAVHACFDTDCNGATVGSVMGAVLGRSRLPEEWVAPINDTLITGVAGYHRVSLSDMARETLYLAR